MQRVTNLPQTVLSQVLRQANQSPATMTDQERAFAQRIRQCCRCEYFWVQRGKLTPKRCPKCHSTQWNMPTLSILAQAEPTTHRPGKQGVTN